MNEEKHDYWVVIKGYLRGVTEEEADTFFDDVGGLGLWIQVNEAEELD